MVRPTADTFPAQQKQILRRLALLERKVGKGSSGGGSSAQQVHVAQLNNARGVTIPNASFTRVDSYYTSDQVGTFLVPEGNHVLVTQAGWVEVTGTVRWGGDSAGLRQLHLYAASERIGYAEDRPGHGGRMSQSATSGPVFVDEGVHIYMEAYQSSGSGLSLDSYSTIDMATNFLRVKFLASSATAWPTPPAGVSGRDVVISGGVIRFSAADGMPEVYENPSHGAPGIAGVEVTSAGRMRIIQTVTNPTENRIVFMVAQVDETLSAKGIIVGPSGGTDDTEYVFYDSGLGRALDLTVTADRMRLQGQYSNLWVGWVHMWQRS